MGSRRRARRNPLRRRHVRRLGRERTGRRSDRGHRGSGLPGLGAGDRPYLSGRAHPGRDAGPGPGKRLAPARTHPPALSPEFPLVDGGWLGRNPLRRSLRHQSHAHRRLRGEHSHVDACRVVGVPAAARQRRRPEPGPPGDRLGRHARHHQRMLAAPAEEDPFSGRARASSLQAGRPAPRRRARSSRPSCGPPICACSTRWKRPAAPG